MQTTKKFEKKQTTKQATKSLQRVRLRDKIVQEDPAMPKVPADLKDGQGYTLHTPSVDTRVSYGGKDRGELQREGDDNIKKAKRA